MLTRYLSFGIFLLKTITIWNQPLGGSCPCTLNAIGLLSHQVTGLVAGQDFTFYMQLTSAYGKKGPVTSFMVATYTDLVKKTNLPMRYEDFKFFLIDTG